MIGSIIKIRNMSSKYGGKMWENARFIMADLPLRRDLAKKLLPMGMWLTKNPTATVFIADYTKTNFTVPYREAALLIHVRTLLGKGLHCCWMVVDDDTALIYGREMLGYPKKLADITFKEKGNEIQASVSRRGITLLTMKGKKGSADDPAPPVFSVKTFNCGGPGQYVIFNPIWLFRPKEVIHQSNRAAVSVAFRESETDPLKRLAAGKPVNGRFAVTDILGGKYMLPVGLAGPGWLKHVYSMRFH